MYCYWRKVHEIIGKERSHSILIITLIKEHTISIECRRNNPLLSDQYACNPGEWACPNNGKCIPVTAVCDHYDNCDNGADEGTTCSKYIYIFFNSIDKV